MEFSEIQERLKNLDDIKLMDVCKNYKQFGYSTEIRNYTLTLLEQRGISIDDLRLTGNLENNNYEYANKLY